MTKSRLKSLESWAHRAMGFGASILNLQLLLVKREWDQLPPENDRYPRKLIHNGENDAYGGREMDEYWAKPRVMDTLRDSREYVQGGTVGWFVVLGVGIWIGTLL